MVKARAAEAQVRSCARSEERGYSMANGVLYVLDLSCSIARRRGLRILYSSRQVGQGIVVTSREAFVGAERSTEVVGVDGGGAETRRIGGGMIRDREG